MHWLLFFCLGLWAATSSAAEVYRSVDPEGNVQYSDQPKANSQVIKIPTAPAPPPETPQTADAPQPQATVPDPAAAKFPGYGKVVIVNPPNEGTVWDNSGNVSIEVSVDPPLQRALGHKLVVLLNGKPLGPPMATSGFTVGNLDRDTYTLQAQIVDGSGQVMRESPPSVFHMKRITALSPAAAPTAPASGR
jgi:hypothetical protein